MPGESTLGARLAAYMLERGLKNTRQRQVILQSFEAAGTHISLDELLTAVQESMPGVGYATVYRTMKMFSEAGIALERRFGDGQTRYEAVEEDSDHHDHLICLTCGHIFEFDDDAIELRQAEITASHGLSIKRHRHDLWGECDAPATCSHRAARERSRS